jgi:succinoglycan biosynthesis transport protein ExoP
MAGSLPLGIVFGLMVAWLRHKLDPRLYTAQDLSPILGFAPMAVLPGFHGSSEKVVDEFLLRLVAGIDQAHSSGGAKTFVLTPVSSSTSMTELGSSLVLRMEQLGYKSLILNASVALQNLSATPEETSAPYGEIQIAVSGETRLTELKRASLVRENLEKLKQNVDLLFIEAMPLLSSAEAEFATRIADVTVLIVESGKTTEKELSSAMELARRLNVAGIAVVLSDLQLRNADPEFVAAVRSVERRFADKRRPDELPLLPARETYPLNIYRGSRPLTPDNEPSVRS